MRLRTALSATIAFVCAATIAANAALTSGTLLNGTIDGNFSSNHAYIGEPVTVSNVTNDDGSGSVVGGRLYGYVAEVQPAGQGRPGKIRFHFTKLVTRRGVVYAIDSRVTGVKVQTKNNALKEVGGALGGMLVGNAIGKMLFHVGGFGLLGAAGGFLLAKNNRQNVNVPAGSIVQVQLLSVTRRQAR
ncbi:MAG TPA: hypothetical protein VMF11_05720 [Candidatus Baltobacteraceae bacterium]|nr:hypothetical protein [Candidatus Baltobacteraceae bacterium]